MTLDIVDHKTYVERKLKRYLQTLETDEDPIEEDLLPSEKRKKIRLAARILRYYGGQFQDCQEKPILLHKFTSSSYLWKSVKRYKTCQMGKKQFNRKDFLTTFSGQRGIILYFTWRDGVQVTFAKTLSVKDLEPPLNTLLPRDTIIETDDHVTISLASISSCEHGPTISHRISCYVWQDGRLQSRPNTNCNPEWVRTVVKAYISCSTLKLSLSPLVEHVSKSIDILFTPSKLAELIVKDFFTLKHKFEHVEDDTNTFINFHRTSLLEGMCHCCQKSRLIVFSEIYRICEHCFTSLRRWYPIFNQLEILRNDDDTMDFDDDLEEVETLLLSILK